MNEPDGRAMYIKLWEMYARRHGVEIGIKFEGEDEIVYVNRNKNRTDAEREKTFYERLTEHEEHRIKE